MPTWDVRFNLPLDLSDTRLLAALARAEALSSVIRGVHISPYVRERLDRLNIVRAVRGTTAIEGADLSEEEVARVIASPEPVLGSARQRDEQETRNAELVMRHISRVLHLDPKAPLSEDMICRINEILTDGISYANHTPGHYRSHGVTAQTYVAPRTGEEVRRLMSEFVQWLNSGPCLRWPPIARAIAAHFYLVSIHPFGDGNGRTSRAVESYLLYQADINAFGFYSLANFYYRHRDEYMAKLDEVRFKAGNLTPFVQFAVDGLVEELEAVHREVLAYIEKLSFRDFASEALRQARLSAKTHQRLSQLMSFVSEDPIPLRSLRDGTHSAAGLYRGASIRTLERDVAELESLRLVVRAEGVVRANLAALRASD